MATGTPFSLRLRRSMVATLFVSVVGTIDFSQPPTAQAQACDDFDQCTVQDMCQADGTCRGTPQPNGTPCDDGNACTLNESCLGGSCISTQMAPNGTPCTSPLGLCVSNPSCQFGFCFGDFVECPDDGNECTTEFCNPQTGQCATFTETCTDDCSAGQCDPNTGQCINVQPMNEGGACDDGNECTANDRCQSGECLGGGAQVPTPTHTPTFGPPSATPTVPTGGCVGDCNGDNAVTVNELIKGVNIALGNAELDTCPSFDTNGDLEVTINEIIQAVNAALTGCPPSGPTPTGQPTATPTGDATPTQTATATGLPPTQPPGTTSVPQRAAATIESTSTALLAIPDFLSAILGHIGNLGAGSGAGLSVPIDIPFDCPAGGGGVASCSQTIQPGFPPTLGPPSYVVTLNSCMVASSAGATLDFTGSLSAAGQQGDTCVSVPAHLDLTIPGLTINAAGATGSTTATFTNVSGSATFSGSDLMCRYDTVSLNLTGTIGVEAKDISGAVLNSTQLTMTAGSSIVINVEQYGSECVPQIYTTTLQGTMTFTSDGTSIDATFTDYRLRNDASSGMNLVTVSGQVASACLGTTVQLATTTVIELVSGMPCPQAGEVIVTSGPADLVRYTNVGGVEIDLDNNGSVDANFGSCLDPALFQCPGS